MEMVSRPDLESQLVRLAQNVGDPRAGLFGPTSVTWTINRESALFLGAGRAALLQLAHPWVAAAIAQHSTVLNRPIVRFHNTFRVVYTMIFGSLPQAFAASRYLHTLHTRIRGELPHSHADHYEANEVAALRWVWATLIETAVLAYETVLPLSLEDRDQYYQEMKLFAALFGIPTAILPANWCAFQAYCRETAESSTLSIDSLARSMGQSIMAGAGSWIHPPHWYRSLTAGWLPPRLRAGFGLITDDAAADSGRRWLSRLYPALPASVRFVGPWREAQERLLERTPGLITRRSNLFWIGQAALPFGGA